MKENADNTIMGSAFVTINRMLKYIERSLDDDVFDLDNFSHEKFKISENRFFRYLKMLADCGYIEGVKVTDLGEKDDFDADDYERFHAEFSSPAITIKGLQFLAENTAWVRMIRAARSIGDIKSAVL